MASEEEIEERSEERGEEVVWAALLAGSLAGLAVYLAGFEGVARAVLGLASLGVAARFAYMILVERRFSVDLLMAVAGFTLLWTGLVKEGLVVMALYGAAELAEERAERLAVRRLEGLRRLIPRRATLDRQGRLVEVSVDEVKPGDTLLVKRGEAVAADMKLLTPGVFDMSHVTGEPGPVEVAPGSVVPSGSVNLGDPVRGVVVRSPRESFLQRLVEEALEAAERKGRVQRLIERLAPPMTFAVLGAFAAASLALGPERGVAVLLAGCPSAFIVSSGYSTALTIASLATRGVVAKGGRTLEAAGRVRVAILDKTGTVTEATMRPALVLPPPGVGEGRFLSLIASLARASLHPVSRSLAAAAQGGLPVEEVREVPGAGVEGVVAGVRVAIGSRSFVGAGSAAGCPQGMRPLYARVDGGVGVVCLEEGVDPAAARAVRELREMGLRVVLASGDSRERVEAAARELGVDEFYSDMKPHDKARLVEEYRRRYGPVLFAGDGINDVEAIAKADVGVAVGSLEAVASAADAAIPRGAAGVPRLVRAGRAYTAALAASFAVAAAIKVVAAVGGLSGALSPILVALIGDDGSTLAGIASATAILLRGAR